MSTPNPLDELKSADGVSLHDLCPPVYVVSQTEIPWIKEVSEFSISKKVWGNNAPGHATTCYFAGESLSRVFQSKARAAVHVAECARAVADHKTREAIVAAMKEGGAA